ncbi:exo-alpha-sialidase [Trypanosoma cruzi]|nr:exo-alpha-sialidase [Trypanosoma cruzi]
MHTDALNEKEEQCTDNTQRLPPIAVRATAGASATRQHAPSDTHTQQSNRRNAKEHNDPSQHPRAAASPFIAVSSSTPAPQPPQAHIAPHRQRIPRRQVHSKRDTSARAAAKRESIHTRPRQPQQHSLIARRQHHTSSTS